jgi:nicotinamide-nucleotide amidase
VTGPPRLDLPLAERTAAVLTVGTELTVGLVADTNAQEIATRLTSASLRVVRTLSVPDDVDAIGDAIRELLDRAALVIVTGGLGPTHDDLTREGASRALGLPLIVDEDTARRLARLRGIHQEEEARQRLMRQAEVLQSAIVLPAERGSAPGMVAPTERGALVLLPGPPHEMRPLLAHVTAAVAVAGPEPRILSCVGITESDALARASRALDAHSGIQLTMLAAPTGVRVVLFAHDRGEAVLEGAATDVAAALGDACYSTDGTSLPAVVVALARVRGAQLSVAESCTGGLVAAELTSVPGASEVFCGGIVAYADEVKRGVLGVTADTLAEHGAVSGPVALEMARGARSHTGASHAVAVTGVAGPGGGSAEKPVGTVWFALATDEGESTVSRQLPGDRSQVRRRASGVALDLLRRSLRRPGDDA